MPRRTRDLRQIGVLMGMLFLGFSCGNPDTDDPPTVDSATVTSTPAETSATPSSTPSVTEQAIDAIVSGNENAVMAKIAYTDMACSNDTWPFPACGPGEAAGATSPRLPFVGCEPSFLDETELRVLVRQIVVGRSPEVFATLVSSELPGQLFPLGPHVVVFTTRPPVGIANRTGILAVVDQSGWITSLRTGCRATPEQLVASVPVALTQPAASATSAP